MLLCEGDDAPSPLLKNMKVQGVKGRREGARTDRIQTGYRDVMQFLTMPLIL
jgi:hypothetical protein